MHWAFSSSRKCRPSNLGGATAIFNGNLNERNRQRWLKEKLAAVKSGLRILDAGAGELRNRVHCGHLNYVSQDFGQYDGIGDGVGMHPGKWDSTRVDLLCDITSIPEPDAAFDVILCSEVLEHVPDPTMALDEFVRLLKPGGQLLLTAPFASIVHFAPYHYCAGFSRYWYEHHLSRRGMQITELTANGDWFDLCEQELMRLGSTARQRKYWSWPLAYAVSGIGALYFKIQGRGKPAEFACFGWHCAATKA